METSVTKRGQTNIPAKLRKRYNIKDGDRLAWIDTGEGIYVLPLPAGDPIELLRGSGRGEKLLESLLHDRREDRERGS